MTHKSNHKTNARRHQQQRNKSTDIDSPFFFPSLGTPVQHVIQRVVQVSRIFSAILARHGKYSGYVHAGALTIYTFSYTTQVQAKLNYSQIFVLKSEEVKHFKLASALVNTYSDFYPPMYC